MNIDCIEIVHYVAIDNELIKIENDTIIIIRLRLHSL